MRKSFLHKKLEFFEIYGVSGRTWAGVEPVLTFCRKGWRWVNFSWLCADFFYGWLHRLSNAFLFQPMCLFSSVYSCTQFPVQILLFTNPWLIAFMEKPKIGTSILKQKEYLVWKTAIEFL